jgi:TRAP transporter 4TM/12TM fusion protein
LTDEAAQTVDIGPRIVRDPAYFAGEGGLGRAIALLITLIAIAYSGFHLWLAGIGLMSQEGARHLSLMGTLALIFLVYPYRGKSLRHWSLAVDLALVALAFTVHIYLEMAWEHQMARYGIPNLLDKVMGVITVILVFEATRRVIGWPLVITVGCFITYGMFGNLIPGHWGHRGYDTEDMIAGLFLSTEGIYGPTTGVVVEFVVLFILFGAFLHKTGAGQFFIDLARVLTGRMRGGSAKTAVVASAFMGSIVGSSTSNVVTTGSITIPMMRRSGYPAHVAAGVEVASSVGGALLPPIMGSSAFLIVPLTGIPYQEIIVAAALPAILYFVSVYANVHFYACRIGLAPENFDSNYWRQLAAVLVHGLPYLIPIVTLVYMLMSGWSATMSAFTAICVMIVTSFFRKETRVTPRRFVEALEMGARNALPVAAACAAVGMIIVVVTLTGVGIKFSSLMTSGTGGSMFMGIVLVGLASLVLGIELPISAAYLVVAVLAAPSLVELGVPLLPAHLICLWFAIDAAVTPPVCITSYVAAGVAGAHPFKTAIAGWKMAKGLYIIPFLMAYTPITLNGPLPEVAMAFLTGALGLISLAAAWEGFFLIKATLVERLILVGVVVTAIDPAGITDYIGIAAFITVLALQAWRRRSTAESATETQL